MGYCLCVSGDDKYRRYSIVRNAKIHFPFAKLCDMTH